MNSARISRIELFAFDAKPSFTKKPQQPGCLYLVLRLSCGEQISYGECVVPKKDNGMDLIKWGAFLRCIRFATLEEGFMAVRFHEREWTTSQLELLQSALSGLQQPWSHRFKIAVGSAGQVYEVPSPIPRTWLSFPLNQQSGDWSLSRLIDESVSYFSLLS
ncbi:hypothetical protein DFP94_1011361 [Fontibacillus phaseoli]|uniref:Uncharacterized protein n=1 Tax=Fontibacillus phaseoli TaxID=1416533 RepID=A0A369BQ54_9BACL|nr:hypothetical protein [Fontibacillus phaseoli]RCX23759.1 hypothetical protein DFP94_1011361 [Fontibacillus phaseoli]